MEAERPAMTSSKRDVQHGVPNFTRCTVRQSGPVKSNILKNPARSRLSESLPALPPVGQGGRPPHVRPTPVFMQVPQPGRPLSPTRLSPVLPALSTAELPRLVAEVGPEVAVGDCLWADGPQLMASVLGVHIPSSADTTQQPCEESTVKSVTEEGTPRDQEKPAAILNTARGSKLRLDPLTGMEVADVFMRKKPLGKRQLVHLEVVEGEAYRPYDLCVVPHDQAGPEHYVFSPSSVLHVRDGGSVGFQTLREWRREALLWNRLQGLSFFRNFRLHRVLSRWRWSVRRNLLRRTRDVLRERMLFAVPQFREALLQVSRLIEELKEVHWLPQDATQAYTLQEFYAALLRRNKEARPLLEKFLQYRSLILNMVHEDSFTAQQVLQWRLEQTRPIELGQPLHLQRAQQHRLRQDLAQSESALRRLGNMAALVSHMTVQNLATVAQREVGEFLRNVVKRTGPQQEALFLTELVFRADGQLSLVPDVHLLHDALRGALCSVTASLLQVIDSYVCESEEGVPASPSLADTPQDLTPDPKLPSSNRESGTTRGSRDPVGSYSDVIHLVPRPLSPGHLVLPNASVPRVEGRRLRGHYWPQSCPSLEWQLSASVGELGALRELDTVIQEVALEVERLCERCSWLEEVRQSCSQWSAAHLEAMRGWPALRYEELIQRAQGWGERLQALPAYFPTANRLITVRCSHIRDDLTPQVAAMEQEVLMFLQEEVQCGSELLVSQLRTAADWLRDEPADLESFLQYASRVQQSESRCSDWRGHMQYLQSLRETLYLYCRPMNPSEALLQAQVRDSWNHFLLLLERAGETVKRNAPSMADILERTASSLIQQLQDLMSQASSDPYTDPSQDCAVMETQLRSMCSRFCTVAAQLEQMKEGSIIITNGEKPLDISSVAEWKQKLEDRRELWELLSVSASYIHEWKQLPFRKFVVLHAQEKVDRWRKQTVSLERTVPPRDVVLKHVRQLLEGFGQQLPLLAELSSPTLKRNHWGNILKGTGFGCTPEQDVTVADLLSTNLLKIQNMIDKVCLEAKAAADTEQTFRSVQQRWEGTLFRLANFLLTVSPDAEPQQEPASRRETPGSREGERPLQTRQSRDSGTFIVIGLEALQSETQDTIMTLSSSLLSPNLAELRPELELWVRQLQELAELLDLWKQYQLKWSYLSKMFQETGAMIQKPELYQRFLPVDETYREMIRTLLEDLRVLNFVQLGHGHPGLHGLLVEGLSTMEGISTELLVLLEGPRDKFPRLCFLSDGEVMELLSLHPTPSSLLPLVRKCFPGVQKLEMAYRVKESPEEEEGLPSTQPWVSGVFGSLGERVPFPCPVEPSLDSLAWMTQLEQRLHSSMVQLMMDCAIARQRCQGQEGGHDLPQKHFQSQEGDSKVGDTLSVNTQQPVVLSTSPVQNEMKTSGKVDKPLSLWDLISSFPLQCLLVVEEALWCQEVQLAFMSLGPAKRSLLKSHYNVKLQSLCQLIQDTCVGRWERSVGSRRVAAALRAMILLAIKHSQQLSELIDLKGELESSFEWQRLMKYHLTVDDCGPCSLTEGPGGQDFKEVSCYVDILNSRLSYSYEYLSPECWTMVRTVSSDQAILGTLLALICYRGGFIAGPRMSGKTETLANLGQALGRTVITMHCYAETSSNVILRMLMGALQTGAWLLLDCADSMPQGVLSLLGQHLADIHRCFSLLLSHRQPQPGQSKTRQELKILPTDKGSIEPGLQVTLGGKTVTAKLGYGCILFSSSRRVAEIPENLRGATRPVYMVQPDYGVIAEATLAALGFSEAASMSRRLVSLLNLAKDSACLPKSICCGQSSWLVLLHTVLTFAGIYLNRSMRVEWEKDRMADSDHEARRQLFNMVLRAPEGLGDGPKSTCRAKFRRANQCVVVMQTIAEEQAIIKAVTSAVASSIMEPGKARHFVTIFGEIFPGARCPPYHLQGREEMQEAALKAAVVEELHEAGLQPNSCLLSSVLALFQALRLSRAVILLGLTGSGKTVCYRALVGALKRLASREAKEDGKEAHSPSLAWSSVDVSVIFPNAMSIDELWGGFNGPLGCWQDGIITKALRETQVLCCTASATTGSSVPVSAQQSRRQVERVRSTRWLVLDGEPLGCASWLDPLYTLCDLKNPLLCFPTGEKLQPPHEALKVLIEATDLSDASPAALARCGLVHHSTEELWRAVWRTQLLSLNKDPTLEHSCLTVWSRLADDLFPRTLAFLRERRLASNLPEHDASGREVTHGVQEVMSFSRVLCSLKEQFGRSKLKSAVKHTDKSEGLTDSPQTGVVDLAAPLTQQELQARNVFVVAYIWGFGGHLHPRHWPQFDEFARSALYGSRYRVVVPAEASVFECLFHLNDGPPVVTHSQVLNRSLQASSSTIPQYERYLFLLRLMAKARQPALVVGEMGSGKTTLCYSAIGAKLPHLRLPVGAPLKPAHLRALLAGVACPSVRSGAMTTVAKQPRLLLFLDDLHDAHCDVFGKASMALETLRQCMSTGSVVTTNGKHFRLCCSGVLSFIASSASPGDGMSSSRAISPRLSRLFSILALPNLSQDLLFSIHSPRLQLWISELPLVADMATCILTATLDLYHAVRQAFPPRFDLPHLVFSPHDLRKVFQGMCLWRPPWDGDPRYWALHKSTGSPSLSVVRLWAHECMRTFGDQLGSDEDRGELVSLLTQVSHRNFAERLASELRVANSGRETDTPSQSTNSEPKTGEEEMASTREESSGSSTEEEEDDEHTESEEVDHSTSCVSVSLSERVELSDVLSEEPDLESVNYSGTADGDNGTMTSHDTLSETSRTTPASMPSPPKDSRPQSELERASSSWSGKLVIRLPQCTSADQAVSAGQSPVSTSMVLEMLENLAAYLQREVFFLDVSRPPPLRARPLSCKRSAAYKEQELEELLKQLATVMKPEEAKQEKGRYVTSYGVHRQGVRQLASALRALLLPGGHGVLFGSEKGTGRKTTVRLAAQLLGYQLLEVHSGNEAALWAMLKEASASVGLRQEGLVLLVHGNVSQVVRDELLVAMANRNFPRLYSYKEWKIDRPSKGSKGHDEDCMLERYFRQVPWNVHVFLLMPLTPGGPETEECISRALSLSSCVEVYQRWDKEARAEVATHYLKRNLQPPHLLTGDGTCLVPSLSNAMSWIHQSARRYTSVLTPDLQPFSTQNYIEFLSHFLYLCAYLYNEGRRQANRLAAILSRMKEMTDQADQYHREACSLSAELSAAQQWQAKVQRDVDSCRSACERARQRCLLEETRLAQLEEQLQQARQLSHDALQQVSPLYQAALEAMRSLSQSDLEELRRYRRPPEGVMGVLDVICVLFARPCTWESCQQLLGSPNFLQELEFYDRSALCWEMFGVLSEAVRRPGFQPEAVREVSRACESLCRWVRAVHQYACAVRRMAPHEARHAQLEAQAAETRTRLRDARLQEEEARVRLEQAERRLQEARSAREELAARLRLAQTCERDAAAAVQQVAPHMASWRALAEETERGIGTIPGDALILAAALAYLGRFGPDVRSELLGKWRDLCVTGRMETDPADPRTAHLSTPPSPPPLDPPPVPVPLGESLQAPIARLLGGVQGVAVGVPPPLLLKLLLWGYKGPTAQRCPLLANTEQRDGTVASLLPGQLTVGVAQAQAKNEIDLVVSADDPTLLDKLKEGSEKGLTVLVTHVERARPTPEFLRLLGRPAQSPTLKRPVSCPSAAPPGFHLFLSTPLPIRALQQEMHPSILAEVQAVDFSLSGAELQEVMLAEIMQSKRPQIWSQNCQARTEKQMLLEKLHQQEVSLMEYVLQTSTPLLQDPHFLPRVSACQTSVSSLREEVQELDQDMERHNPLLARFRVEAGLVADFYQALQEVARLSPLYLFPLRCYLPALREGLALQETPDLTFGGDEGIGEVSAEVLVAHLMVHFRPCLSQSHANVLRLLISVAVSRHGEGCSEAERVAFLRGLGDEDFPGVIQSVPVPSTSPSQLPDWLPATAEREVIRLESLPSFRGLTASLTSNSEQWAEYLRYPSSTVIGPVPCPSHSHLSILQRALLWKTLLPHWLAAMAGDFAACQLGKPFQAPLASNPHPGTPEALSQIVERAKGPIVLILPEPSEAAPPVVHPLSLLDQTAQSLTEDSGVKTVQVVTFGAECQREMVMKALDAADQEGHWLVFNNCHLLNQWDDEVVCRLTQLVSCTKEGHGTDSEAGRCGKTPGHPDFRLWFITRANAPLSIPAAVRPFALRLACDSPWDLGEVLRCSLRQISSASAAVKPIRRCVALHAVLLQRRAYRHLGQAQMYCWTQEDLQALLDAQVRISSHCSDPVGTLEYIAGVLVYGGHVEDPADLEAMKGVARACLRPPPPLWGRGPHTLAELIACSRLGSVPGGGPLQQAVEGCIQACAPSSDPLLLGLSSGLEGELVRMRSHTLRLLLRDTQTHGAPPPAPALPLLTPAQDRLQALRDTLGRGRSSRATPQTPLGLFLQQEWDGLVEAVASTHASLTEPGKNCAPRPTLCTLSRLEARARLLGAYLWKESPETPPYAYCLSAFANPRGFLAALLREGARGEQGDVSRLSLHFQVLSAGTVPSSPPLHGAYLCGLELQGALWDTRLNALQDTLSPKPCLLPPVWVTAQSRPRKMPPGDGSTSLPLYRCPLYLDGEFGDGGVIIRVPLAAKLDPVLCALRPVRLVSTL